MPARRDPFGRVATASIIWNAVMPPRLRPTTEMSLFGCAYAIFLSIVRILPTVALKVPDELVHVDAAGIQFPVAGSIAPPA